MKKMKVRSLYLTLLGLVSLTVISCSDDDHEEIVNFDINLLVGDWISIEAGNATEVNYSYSHSLKGSIYRNIESNPDLYENMSGTWFYYIKNGIINTEMLYNSSANVKTVSYKLSKLDNYNLELRNQELGSSELYMRIVEKKKVAKGDEFDVNFSDVSFTVTDYISTSPSILSIDSLGHAIAKKAGIAYVIMKSQDHSAVVRVEVGSLITSLAEELFVTIDDVLNRMGKPDVEGVIDQNKAIQYSLSNSSLDIIQYRYDESTRDITTILVSYGSDEEYSSDVSYIKTNY